MYIWVMLHHRHQISIITDAVFLGHVLQFTPVQVMPGLCYPWERQQKCWYLQDTMASRGREPGGRCGMGTSAYSSLAGTLEVQLV